MTTNQQDSTTGHEIVKAERAPMALVQPIATPADIIQHHKQITTLITQALKEGQDYGVIPGTNKPTLLKPGAERLALAFGTHPEYSIVESEIDHDRPVSWQKKYKSGQSVGLYRFVLRCHLVRQDGLVVGDGLGSCSTMESKYVDRPRDMENTVLKMASKRAFLAAVLNAFGLSDRFTQDVEDDRRRLPSQEQSYVDPGPYDDAPVLATEQQKDAIVAEMQRLDIQGTRRQGALEKAVDRRRAAWGDITADEAERALKTLRAAPDPAPKQESTQEKDAAPVENPDADPLEDAPQSNAAAASTIGETVGAAVVNWHEGGTA